MTSSPPKPWEVNPAGTTATTSGDGSPAPVTDAVGGSVGATSVGTAGVGNTTLGNNGLTGNSTMGGSNYNSMNRYGNNSMYSGGGLGGMGSYGGMGMGGYGGMGMGMGGYGGMGMMGMGMGMNPAEQRSQMLMFFMNRMGEMVSSFSPMLQQALNSSLSCVANVAELKSQYNTIPNQTSDATSFPQTFDLSSPTNQQVAEPEKDTTDVISSFLYNFLKKVLFFYVIYRLSSVIARRLDKVLV